MQPDPKHVRIPGPPTSLDAPKKTAQRRRSPRARKRDQLGNQQTFAWMSDAAKCPPPAAVPSAVPLLLFLALSLASIAPPAAATEPTEDSAAAQPAYLTEEAPLHPAPDVAPAAPAGDRRRPQLLNKRHLRLRVLIHKLIHGRRFQDPETDHPRKARRPGRRADRLQRRHDRDEGSPHLRDRWRRHTLVKTHTPHIRTLRNQASRI